MGWTKKLQQGREEMVQYACLQGSKGGQPCLRAWSGSGEGRGQGI